MTTSFASPVIAALSIAAPHAAQDPPEQPVPPQVNKNYFNPQMAIVFDFRGRLQDPEPSERKADFNEIEFGFASDVDPFLKAEAYIAVAKEDGETVVEVEEAFGRYTRLAPRTEAKVGKFAAAIGRVQRNHGDQLEYLDYPLFIEDMLGEEGLRAPGASVAYLFPGERFMELTFEALVPQEAGTLFGETDLGSPLFVSHFRTFFDFNDDLSAQLGATYANGRATPVKEGTVETRRAQMYGFDFVAKWQPGTKGKSAILESELYWGDPNLPGAGTAIGGFAALSYEVTPRWFATVKKDYSEIPGTSDIRRGISLGITHRVTEFHHWRLEWQRITSNFEPDANRLTLQFQFLIGAHPAHKY